ncbi:FtsQ-type POTRA domain-containing protein [Parafrigoribacterium soli]|uniref:FtsQ-type POTRA domain-containing protein n=1 Tax=Parafrigoribacterium soli TaxID=3144663 RepID=UPI0032EAEF85
MKRPEGFDPRPPQPQVPPTGESDSRGARGKSEKQTRKKSASRKSSTTARAPKVATTSQAAPASEAAAAPKATKTSRARNGEARDSTTARRAAAEARKAARIRRRYERSEVRRFTRRSRHRRLAWLTAGGAIFVLCALVAIAVYSPLLALKTIRIEGASRVSAADIRASLKDQLGTPLALLDFAEIKTDLAKFPLIRSYVTEAVPPNTLIVHILERSPIGVLESPSGYTVVDAAGVTISHSTERPQGLPIIDSGSLKGDSTAFKAAVAVLLALPDSVAKRVGMVTARTNDDVTLVLDGVGQRVVWGSADRSAMKGRVLADLIAHQDPNTVVEYDVSAPNNAVVRTG